MNESELAALNNLVEQYLAFAEGQALRRIPMHMQGWITKLDGFLSLNERDILTHAGKISHKLAISHAEQEYDQLHRRRIAEDTQHPDDFEKCLKQLPSSKPKTARKRNKKSDQP
ncbi:MAG: virulence RhuM family protein [Coprothermobacterota bacterium]|nr:virulence RhuM family protein [Coprothermobacterota bacterium]